MGSPPAPAAAPPPPPLPPMIDHEAQRQAKEASRKARQIRSNASGYSSTILTGGLGVLDTPTTRFNNNLGL
jgi:hypothetical protein